MSEVHIPLREKHTIGAETREWIVTPRMAQVLLAYGIYLTGWSEARGGFAFFRPCPDRSQVLVCLSGMGEAVVDGRWCPCGPGTAYLTPPGRPHAYRALPGGAPWVVVWVTHGSDAAQERPLVDRDGPVLVSVNPQALAASIHGLYAEAMGEAMGAVDAEVLGEWASLVSVNARRIARPAGGDPRLHRLWEVVVADLGHSWGVRELARRAGMSGEHLRRLCRQETGRSPMQQVTHLRMRHAAALLSSESYPIIAVAVRVGYDNPFAFSAAFKRTIGLAPSAYRERVVAGTFTDRRGFFAGATG
jgi:AraC-like DNA-binding protein